MIHGEIVNETLNFNTFESQFFMVNTKESFGKYGFKRDE